MTITIRAALAGAAALLLTAAAVAARVPQPDAHPPIQADQQCAACHESRSPRVVKLWKASKHGAAVSCATCHGAVGADFAKKPAATRCETCHFEQVEQLRVPEMQGKTCFSCHHPHALSPHMALAEGGR